MKKQRVKVNPKAMVAWCYSSHYYGRGEPYCTRVDQVDYGTTGRKQVYLTIRDRRWGDRTPSLYPLPVTISKKNDKKEKGYYINISPNWNENIIVQVLKQLSKESLKKEVVE